jgi:integrase/recombinase XerC
VSGVADGEPSPPGAEGRATFHALRHRFGTQVYANSLDLRVTQEILGQSSPATTAGYAAWSPERGIAAVAALP